MSEEKVIAESYSNLKSAILLGRTDIVRGILSTAAESRFENGFFEDEVEDELDGEDFRIKKWDEDYDDNPYDILRVMLNYIDDDAGTALHLATKLGNADITRALLSAGADPTRLNKERSTPFDYCSDEKILWIYNEQLLESAAHNQLTKLERLLTAGVSANASDGSKLNNHAIHWAATFGGHEAVKLLCEHKADVNVTNSEGSTALFDAVKRRDKEIVSTLLSYGARTDICLSQGLNKGKTPIDLAPENSEIMTLLLNPPDVIIIPSTEKNKEYVQTNGTLSHSVDDSTDTSNIGGLGDSKPDLKDENTRTTDGSHDLDLTLLWPYPQKLTLIKGSRFYPEAYLNIRIQCDSDGDPHNIHDMWRAVDDSFRKLGISVRVLFTAENTNHGLVPGIVTCSISPLLFSKPESYSIHISSEEINLCSGDQHGLWFSITTLLQLFRISKGLGIPKMQIYDWPDLRYRAFLVDCNHGRTPTMESLLFLVDVLAGLKYNQMVLCVGNSSQLDEHEETKDKHSPYTQGDILRLDRYCRKRFIELVPYGEHFVCGEAKSDTSADLNSQLSVSFPSSRFIHIGLGKVQKSVLPEDKKLPDSSLLNQIRSINEQCMKHRKTCLVWSSLLHDHIKEGNSLPHGVIAMEYGGKSSHDFGVFCRLCSDSGIPYYVCPGTMTWTSLVGPDSFDLIDDAVQTAVHYNALGILVTDWSGYGHVAPLEVGIPALTAAGVLAWNSKMKQESVLSSLGNALDLHVFQDEAGVMGEIYQSLWQSHRIIDPTSQVLREEGHVYPVHKAEDASQLLRLFLFPNSVDMSTVDGDRVQNVSRCLRKCQASLSKAQMKNSRCSTIVKVLNLNLDMAIYACRVGRALALAKSDKSSASGFTPTSSLQSITRTDLANRLLGIIESHRRVWGLSNKPDGLEESVKVLRNVFQEILPSSTQII